MKFQESETNRNTRPFLKGEGGADSRYHLAEFARREAALKLAGNANMAGPAIERYLSMFRDALNLNGATREFSDITVGFSWCCAFVYYCCRHSGFEIDTKPDQTFSWTLAAVPAWCNWSEKDGTFVHPSTTSPQVGDIALLNNAAEGKVMDHIGIVVASEHEHFLSAEGNNANRTGLFRRDPDMVEGYVRLRERV